MSYYEEAKKIYAHYGVDTDSVLDQLSGIPSLSIVAGR